MLNVFQFQFVKLFHHVIKRKKVEKLTMDASSLGALANLLKPPKEDEDSESKVAKFYL